MQDRNVHINLLHSESCSVCGDTAHQVDHKKRLGIYYIIMSCPHCGYSFISNPRTDYMNIYNHNYYNGLGVDPKVRYEKQYELGTKSIKYYEYRGLHKIFNKLTFTGNKWLDYGCGVGGLLRYGNEQGIDIAGFDEGYAADFARRNGHYVIDRETLSELENEFDFISAVEVLEHVNKPLEVFTLIRRLLKPGGVFFLTTGNARCFNGRLSQWHYTNYPEAHISFYEPRTISYLLGQTGFEIDKATVDDGYGDIIKYKLLNYLNFDNRNHFFDSISSNMLGRIIETKFRLTDIPFGRLV